MPIDYDAVQFQYLWASLDLMHKMKYMKIRFCIVEKFYMHFSDEFIFYCHGSTISSSYFNLSFFFSDFTYLNACSIKIENLPAILQSYYQYQDTTWCTVDAQ